MKKKQTLAESMTSDIAGRSVVNENIKKMSFDEISKFALNKGFKHEKPKIANDESEDSLTYTKDDVNIFIDRSEDDASVMFMSISYKGANLLSSDEEPRMHQFAKKLVEGKYAMCTWLSYYQRKPEKDMNFLIAMLTTQ